MCIRDSSETMGLEVTGVISSLGQDVTGWSEDDEVIALLAGGGYAEYVIDPAGQLLPIPEGIDPVTASTLIEVTATVISNMDHVGLARGETFLVHGGAGGIGQFAIQYAKSLECTVITTCGTAEKQEFCRTLGADVILDVMGAKYLDLNVDALAIGGRLDIIGMQGGIKGELNIAKLLNKRALVTATSLRPRPLEEKAKICQRVREVAWPLYTNGSIKPAPVESFPMSEAGRAHERLESGEVLGKVALTL